MTAIDRFTASQIALWSICGALVLALHAGGIKSLAGRPDMTSVQPDLTAVLVDLDPVPAAPAVPDRNLPEGRLQDERVSPDDVQDNQPQKEPEPKADATPQQHEPEV